MQKTVGSRTTRAPFTLRNMNVINGVQYQALPAQVTKKERVNSSMGTRVHVCVSTGERD